MCFMKNRIDANWIKWNKTKYIFIRMDIIQKKYAGVCDVSLSCDILQFASNYI